MCISADQVKIIFHLLLVHRGCIVVDVVKHLHQKHEPTSVCTIAVRRLFSTSPSSEGTEVGVSFVICQREEFDRSKLNHHLAVLDPPALSVGGVCPSGSTDKRERIRPPRYCTSRKSRHHARCTSRTAPTHARLEKKQESDRREGKKSVLEKQTRV